MADTDRGLAEMTRVCRPGGQVAVLEFSTPRCSRCGRFYLFYFRHILPRIGQFFARNKSAAYEYLPASVGQFPDGEALPSGCARRPEEREVLAADVWHCNAVRRQEIEISLPHLRCHAGDSSKTSRSCMAFWIDGPSGD